MKCCKYISFIFLFAFWQATLSDEIILQNGLNGYDGCEDAYIATNNLGKFIYDMSPSNNYGSTTELRAHRESC